MLILLSPAKSLDFKTPITSVAVSEPVFLDEANQLAEQMRMFSPAQIAVLMSISDALADLNFQRFSLWSLAPNADQTRPAVLAFNGDVYEGLDAKTLSLEDLNFAQEHVGILSGLYGFLRPLDGIQPYRLEMGTRLKNLRGKDLYAFWGDCLTGAVNDHLSGMASQTVVNLASEEYFKAVRRHQIQAPVIQPVFEDWKGGRYRIISFYAKRARGLMARYAVQNRLTNPEGLKAFDVEGYVFDPQASDSLRWVFRRREVLA